MGENICKWSDWLELISKIYQQNFPGGPVVKNPLTNAGDTGSIPGPRRFHMLWSDKACVPQLLKPIHPRACSPKQEKPPQQAPLLQLEKAHMHEQK